MTDRVFIRHTDQPHRNGYVTRTAFDALWAKKGYVIEGDEATPSTEAGQAAPAGQMAEPQDTSPVSAEGDADTDGSSDTTADQLNAALDEKAQLRSELEARGVEVDGRWGLKRLRTEVATARDANS